MHGLCKLFLGFVLVVLSERVIGENIKTNELRMENMPSQNRILFLAPISTRSHYMFYEGVVNALVDNDNQVTMVTDQQPRARPGVRHVFLEDINVQQHYPNMFTEGNQGMFKLTMKMPELCMTALAKPQVQALLNEHFDVVLLGLSFSNCFLSITYQLQVPFVYVLPLEIVGYLHEYMGNPPFLSVAGNLFLEYKHPLTFKERLFGALFDAVGTPMTWYMLNKMDTACKERGLCPEDMPKLNDLHYNASMLIENSVRGLQYPARPIMPSVIAAGGIHCRPAHPLPQALEEWVQGAGDDGFIFFSLGSAVRPSDMPERYRRVLVKVLGSLKQRVLWKWDQDNMEDLPANVRLEKWLPQQDLLGHPSLRLFMTHGGLLSTQEATYHGVPVLGLPVFVDQHNNMRKAEGLGWARMVAWEHLTEDLLYTAIQDVMHNDRMKTEARRRSVVMRDSVAAPGDVAVYWVEYVIRHAGAPHLRSPFIGMAWYEVYNADVWGAVAGLVLATVYCVYKMCRCCCARRKPKNKQE